MYSKIKIIVSILFPSVLLGLTLSLVILASTPGEAKPLSTENIKVFFPLPGGIVRSPLKISGEARGIWFFEASFPIKIFDGNGAELGIMPAQAEGEWMTTDFVPFEATLEFKKSETKEGRLVFQKDNPSGLPEHDAEESFIIKF